MVQCAAVRAAAAYWIPADEAIYACVAMRIHVLLVALLPTVAAAAEVYRWVGEDGVVHYSDRPQEGAETVVIEEPQTFSTPAPRTSPPGSSAPPASTEPEQAAADEAPTYSNFEIVRPKQEEVFWNIGGELSVSLRAKPRIQAGHTIFLVMDGQEVQQLQPGRMQAMLSDVFRGTHTLHAEVRDKLGNTVAKSESVQFTVQQTSIQNPNNPNRPGGSG